MIAGITVFRPDRQLLGAVLDRLANEGLSALVYVDGPTGDAITADLLTALVDRPGVTIMQAPANAGIGAGLNALAERARALEAQRMLIFDQDSLPERGLAAKLEAHMAALQQDGQRPAAVGPTLLNPAEETAFQPPRYRPMPGGMARGGVRPVRYLITSGTLLDLAAFAAIGLFRADYVMDAIDVEWCFRAWSRGYSIWVAEDVSMEHRVGRGVFRLGPLRFPRQSPDRMATYIRNQAHGFRLAHVPLGWKLRNLIYLPLQTVAFSAAAPHPTATLLRLLRAARDGFAGRLGKPLR